MDPCRNGKDHPPLLVEGARTQWEGVAGHPPDKGRPQQLWGPSTCLVAGGGVQAAHGPTWGLGVVDAPPGFSRLFLMNFLFHTDASSPRDFLARRQEKTLALAKVLQACTEDLGSQQSFSASQHENFKSALPPNHPQQWWHCWGLPSKAHWRQTQDTPTPEEEATLLGKEIKLPKVPGSPPWQLEIPRFVEPAKQSTTPSASYPSPAPQPSCLPSGKAKKSQQGKEADPDTLQADA